MKRFYCFGIVLCMITLLSASYTYAEPGLKTEITTDFQGHLLTRIVAPGSSDLINETAPAPNSSLDQQTLWMTEDPTAIAQNVDVTGNGQNIITGWWLNSMRTSKYNTIGSGAPLWEYPQSVSFYLPVAASDDGGVVASTGATIPLNVWLSGAGPNPSWQYTYTTGYNGVDCDVSDNGTYVAAICKQTGTATGGKLMVFNSSSSTPFWTVDFDAGNQANGVEISENNGWITVGCYSNIYVYQMSTQSLFATLPNYSQTMVGIDDDAEYLASGDFYGVIHLYRRIGASYTQQWQNTMGGWVTAVDISSDASTVLAGNFTYSPANAGLARAFTITGTVLWSYNQYGDYVADVALCNDGSIGIAGSWGQLDATYGDVFTAFNMATGSLIYQLLDDVDEPGSIFDVAISDDGSLASCGGKAVHARTFGNGGEVYSLELGAVVPNVSVTLTPINPPIVIPATGGSFNYTAAVANNETTAQTFDTWIMVQLPSGSYYGPVLGPVNLTLPAGASISRQRTQNVPASAPAGDYDYIGYVGTYNTTVWDSSSFNFTKLGAGVSGLGSGEWITTGEPFSSEIEQIHHSSFLIWKFPPIPLIPLQLSAIG